MRPVTQCARLDEWMPLRWVLALAAPAALVAVIQLGRLHPDEVYQSLEPAFFRIHGYGVMAWEWQKGIRNWAVPLLFSELLRVCRLLGVTDPRWYRAVLEVPQYALHAWSLWAAFRFARRRVEGDVAALWATALVALWGWMLMFAGRTMGESFSASFLMVAFEAVDRPEEPRPWRAGALAGLGLGLAVVTRYGSAVFVVAGLLSLVLARRWRTLAATAASGAVVAAALGTLDYFNWGAPFHSLRVYLAFNVFSGYAAAYFGASPPSYYLLPILALTPPWAWVGLYFAARTERPRVSAPVLAALLYLAVIAATPHKESRFVYPALALLVMTAAPALIAKLRSLPAQRSEAAFAAALVLGLLPLLWPPSDLKDVRGDQFRAIVRATRDADATGLLIVGEGIWGSGGYFYVGKNIPWGVADWPQDANFQGAIRNPRVNRVVTIDGRGVPELQQAGFRVVGQIGRESILSR